MRELGAALLRAGVLTGGLFATQDPPPAVDPAIGAAVERFYSTQEAEDLETYLSLWSRHAQRPRPEQLRFIFESGDDKFTGIAVRRVTESRDLVRVRISGRRERTLAGMPAGPSALRITAIDAVLTFVREDDAWKLLREGSAADDLADALIAAASAEQRRELLASHPDVVGTPLLEALAQRGGDAARRRAYEEAETLFNLVIDVARRAGDRAAEGQALQNLANTFYFRGRHSEALAAYEARLTIERERNDPAGIASALVGIGTIRYAYAEYGLALASYREALVLQERLSDEPAIATTLISTGNVQYLQGDYQAAISDYQRSLTLSRKTFTLDTQSRALQGLGRVFAAQGDFGGALAAFSELLADATARKDRSRQGAALQHIGEVQFKLGNLDEARSSFDASRVHFDALKDIANVGRLWQAMALMDLGAGRVALAEKEYTTSIAVCSVAQDEECIAQATVGLAFAQSAQEKYVQAIASYAKAIAAFTKLGSREDAARAEVGSSQAFAGKGDLQDALNAARRAREGAIAISSDDVLWRALLAEARILRRKRDPAALGAARAALATVERLQQLASERPGTVAPADGVEAFATLAVLQAEAGDTRAAFAVAEQMRHYRLRTTLTPNEREIARGMTVEEREEERLAAGDLSSLGTQLARERSLPKPNAARLDRLAKAQADAIARRAAQQRRLFERLPDLRVWRGLGPSADAGALDRLLLDADAVIAFVVDEDDLLVLVATRNDAGVALSAYVTPLSRRKLAERVAALVQPSILRDVSNWTKLAAEFARALPADAVATISSATRVIVLPDATLWRVPFEALPVGDGYLADRASVTYAGSMSAALQVREAAPSTVRSLLAVAAPEVAPAVKERVLSTAPGWTLRAPDVGAAEVTLIAAQYGESESQIQPPMVLLGQEANEAQVRARAGDPRILHFAAPFRVNAASPLFSPLLFGGGAADAGHDGVLEAREIMNLDLAASLVVLSDGSALTMRDAAAALDAIEWAWRAAGVRSLLLARWAGEPAGAEALLAEFHRRVGSGERADDALRAARARVRTNDATAAPFYWAGWLLIDAPAQSAAAAR